MGRQSEGSQCTCPTLEAHAEMIARINESFNRDYDGSRRKYADKVSTSQALRQRALASTNGTFH